MTLLEKQLPSLTQLTTKRRSFRVNKRIQNTLGTRKTSLKKNKLKPAYSALSIKSHNQNKSATNEDRYAVKKFPSFVLFAIFDGHSGPAISEYTSSHFLNYLGNQLAHKGTDPCVFEQAFLSFDNILQNKFFHKKDGSTASVVYIDKKKIISANIGDSPAYLVKQRNTTSFTIKHITTEHDYNNEKERKRVTSAGGKFQSGYYIVDNYMLQPTRGFGDFLFKKAKGNLNQDIYTALPTIREIPISFQDKFVILATDGILLGKPNEPQNTITKAMTSYHTFHPNIEKHKWILSNILQSKTIFGNPPYYPDDVTAIVIDLHLLMGRI